MINVGMLVTETESLQSTVENRLNSHD